MTDISLIPKVAPNNETGVPRILIPAGIGDAYWVMVKIRAFCRSIEFYGKPDILVLSIPQLWMANRLRSVPFLRRLPFINVPDNCCVSVDPVIPRPPALNAIYEESLSRFGRTVFPGLMGYEYFISYNGLINSGHWLEKDDPLECEWNLGMLPSEEQDSFEELCRRRYGRYAVFYFSSFTDYMVEAFKPWKIAKSISRFCAEANLIPVFIGADWDLDWPQLVNIIRKVKNSVNLVGKTTLNQAFGAIMGAEIISGYHCGLTNMAASFGKRTLLLWGMLFFKSQNTMLSVVPPEVRMTSYIPLDVAGLTIEQYIDALWALLEK